MKQKAERPLGTNDRYPSTALASALSGSGSACRWSVPTSTSFRRLSVMTRGVQSWHPADSGLIGQALPRVT